jgi:hypothetical protein
MRRLLVALLCLLPSWAGATTYYVDCAAGAGGDGSLATPWDAIADVNGASFSAGDGVLLKRGCTWSGEMLTPPSSGSAGNVITISSYDSGAIPIIDAVAVTANALYINGKDYLTIDGLSFKRGSNGGQGVVWIEGGADHLIFQNNEVSGGPGKGVNLQYNAGGYNQILSNSVHNNGSNGIGSYIHTGSTNDASRTIIRGNTVYSNGGDGIHIRANYWTVEYNLVYDNGGANEYLGIHPYTLNLAEGVCDNAIIRYNVVRDQTGNGNDGAGIGVDQWCDNAQVYYNVSYANDGPGFYGYDAPGLILYNNTSYGNCQNSSGQLTGKAEIRLDGSVSDLQTATIKNNIAQATMADTYAIYVDSETIDNTLDITNNVWYASAANWYFWNAGGGATLATWNALTGVGTDLNSDPLMMSPQTRDFRLQNTSPAINAGVSVGLTTDYAGNLLVGAPDMGALENQYVAPVIVNPNVIGGVGVGLGGSPTKEVWR